MSDIMDFDQGLPTTRVLEAEVRRFWRRILGLSGF